MDVDTFARQFSRGTLFRLFIPDLVAAEKTIYLDCDVAVNLDIAEFWNIDIADVSLAVIPDLSINRSRSGYEKLRARIMQYDLRLYFNAGILLMNLARIRSNYDLLNEFDKFVRRYGYCATSPDQDFLNRLFRDDRTIVSEKFDRIEEHHNIDDAILHLCGPYRPFALHLCEPRDYFYWEVFNRSEWRDQIVDAMLEVYKNSVHVRTSSCWRCILKRLKADIFHAPIIYCKMARICITELRHRIMGL
jgi:lipopolysaccharide biosynthesis glycosyltransferase